MSTRRIALVVLASLGVATEVYAQAQLPGYGHAASGMGGAAIAVPYDSIAAANNPAGMAYVGSRTDISLTAILTNATSELGPSTYDASDWGFGPLGGFNQDLKNGWTVGVSVYGFGSGIDYEKPFPGSTTDTTSTIAQIIVAPTATYRLAPQHAIGIAPLLAAQRLEITGLQSFGFQDPGADSSYGVGVAVGYLGTVAEGLMIGLSYASRINMGALDRYATLLADGGNQDIPQQFGVGLSWQSTPQFLLAFDYLWIDWSSVKPLGNPFPGSGPPGSPHGPGSEWQDQSVYRLGLAFEASRQWTVRVGATYKSKLIVPQATTLNTLTPLLPQWTLTFGATYRIDQHQAVHGALAHNFEKSLDGTQASSGINLTSSASFFTIGYSYSF